MTFAERVYEVTALIPEGHVTSYGAIARALGAPRSARMVGWALNNSPHDRDLPAHRVVNRVGILTGAIHFGPPDEMRHRLEVEGVTFIDEITVDMKAHFWDPADDPRVDEFFQFLES
ncbi:MAG: MGMT family protein [Thermomicrobiales bacterium]|nr:MGMT family protein [Thermomicrobiales bacterium]